MRFRDVSEEKQSILGFALQQPFFGVHLNGDIKFIKQTMLKMRIFQQNILTLIVSCKIKLGRIAFLGKNRVEGNILKPHGWLVIFTLFFILHSTLLCR